MSSTLSYFQMFTDKVNKLANNSTVTTYFKEKIAANKDTINAKLQVLSTSFKDARANMNKRIQALLDSTTLDEQLLDVATKSKALVLCMGPNIQALSTSLEIVAASDPELEKTLAPSLVQLYELRKVIDGIFAAINIGQQLATNTAEIDVALQNNDFDSVVLNAKEVQEDIFKSLGILETAGMLPSTLTSDKIAQLNEDISSSIKKAEEISPLLVKKETHVEATRPAKEIIINKPTP